MENVEPTNVSKVIGSFLKYDKTKEKKKSFIAVQWISIFKTKDCIKTIEHSRL